MNASNTLDFEKILGTHTLLFGETDTKKTLYTAKFLEFLLETKKIPANNITVLDFAPKLAYIDNLKIGGKIQDYYDYKKKYNSIPFEGEIIPPRMNARSKKELYEIICHNHKIISKVINIFNDNPTKILIINDLSIYLHLGNKSQLLNIIGKTNTFLGNAYYGSSISSKFARLLSAKEKKRVEFLIKNVEIVYNTNEFDFRY